MDGLQAGETALALQRLARRYTGGNKSQLMGAHQKAKLVVAVKMEDLAEVRHLIECEGTDINARDHVSCGFIDDS